MTEVQVDLDRLERTVTIAAPVEKVWAALTKADLLARWLGEDAEIDLRLGGRIRLTWYQPDPSPVPDDCYGSFSAVIVQIDEPVAFAFRWAHRSGVEPGPGRDTLVRFTLFEVPGGTEVTVVETGFATLDTPDRALAREENLGGWAFELRQLAALLS